MSEIKNIRYGIATNSSSTHSIIHISEASKYSDDLNEEATFGWDFFTAVSSEVKRDYMFQQLLSNLANQQSCKDTLIAFTSLYAEYYKDVVDKIVDGYVDHQSVMFLPRYINSDDINIEFFTEYTKYLMENYFVVLGGNDNDDIDHPLSNKATGHPVNSIYHVLTGLNTPTEAFKNGNYWVLYDGRNTKYRVSFNGDEELNPVLPELIDIKITDYCNIGCSFCYQDSTKQWQPADLQYISAMLQYHNPPVKLEFAIGGGEPTTNPKFEKVLEMLYHYGNNIVNFTTKSKEWFGVDYKVEAVKKYVSGVAYSVSSIEELKEFAKLHKKHCGGDVKIYAHIIPKLLGLDKTEEIVRYVAGWNKDTLNYLSPITITMLGFKEIGRGEGTNVKKLSGIIDLITSSEWVDIGIDTKLANDYARELEKFGIDKRLYTTKEGQFSIYYDAVRGTVHKSSYELEKTVPMIDNSGTYLITRNLETVFKEIREE